VSDAWSMGERLFRLLMKCDWLVFWLIAVPSGVNAVPRDVRVEPHSESGSLMATQTHLNAVPRDVRACLCYNYPSVIL
jgi:hypothetical protein